MSNHADFSEVAAQVRAPIQGSTLEVSVIRLVAGETAWNPASTKEPLRGPARVDYFWHPDGGVSAMVGDLDRDL